jgi:acyl-CoA dehydrogenase
LKISTYNVLQAEKALEWALASVGDPKRITFGKPLAQHGMMIERVAKSRIDIDAARLAVLNAAQKIDEGDAKHALKEIAEVKVLVPKVMTEVVDRAIQANGGAGVCQDTPLAAMSAIARMMRIVDGPDEVHLYQLGRNEIKQGLTLKGRIEAQKARTSEMFKDYGILQEDNLSLNRVSGQSKL